MRNILYFCSTKHEQKNKTMEAKKIKEIKAGNVVLLEWQGDSKPCEKSMALLLSPVMSDNVETLVTAFGIDLKTGKYVTDKPILGVRANVKVVRGKKKEWYFEQVMKQVKQMKLSDLCQN